MSDATVPNGESFWDYFWFAKIFFRLAGIIPFFDKPSSMWKSMFSRFLTMTPVFYPLVILYQPLNYILFRRYDLNDTLESLTMVVGALGEQFRSYFMIKNRRKIINLFSICEKLWDSVGPEDRALFRPWVTQARIFSTIFFCAGQSSAAMLTLFTVIKQRAVPENSTVQHYLGGSEEKAFPSPTHELLYSLEIVSMQFGVLYITAADMTGTVLVLNMCGQLDVVKNWLRRIEKPALNATGENIDKRLEVVLRKFVRRHQIIIDFCTKLEETICYVSLAQVLTGMYTMAILMARLNMKSGSSSWYTAILRAVASLFLSCWPADNLYSESIGVAQAVYDTPWYLGSSREKIAVGIIQVRAQRAAQITAGKFVLLSLAAFSSMISHGLSLSMLLRTV